MRKLVRRLIFALPLLAASAPSLAQEGSGVTGKYSHARHAARNINLKCEVCHASSPDGKIDGPSRNHKPCSNEGCHASEFRRRDSALCLGCHEHNKPFKKNPFRPSFKEVSEFKVGFSHRSHAAGSDGGTERSRCAQCHREQAGLSQRTTPPGHHAPAHTQCSSCHAELAEPHMLDCSSCHKSTVSRFSSVSSQPSEASKRIMKMGEPWRVREKFAHKDHQRDIRTAQLRSSEGGGSIEEAWGRYDAATARELACSTCHVKVAMLEDLSNSRPQMKGCAESCHNGKWAFKATGFECLRCHLKDDSR